MLKYKVIFFCPMQLLEVMKIDNANGRIPVDDFLELVARISDIRHPNILELVGYCAEYEQRLLVYNHFSRKTLHDVLHEGEELDDALSWNARLQVALHAAKALEYLHDTCEPPVVHQNFEPANVLLDNRCSVHVAECGLAELMLSGSVTQLSGRMRALLNYEAPEIHESGPFTNRSDVYSFGVVMLELLTGRRPFDSSRPRAEQHLVRWADSQLHDIESISKMVDPAIRGECSDILLSRFADIISQCIQTEPEFRPAMSAIVQDLTRIVGATGEGSE
jgi:serine/threonine protein kinase